MSPSDLMTRGLGITAAIMLVSASAHAGWFGFGNSSSGSSYTPPSNTTGYKYGTGYTTSKVPFWKRRYLERQQLQWQKPGGVNFPTPGKPQTTAPSANTPQVATPEVKQQKLGFWARMREAWRARWGNRQLNKDKTTPLENQAGFGSDVRRAHSNVAYSWRNRLDRVRKRIRQRRMQRRHSVPGRPPLGRRGVSSPPGW